MEKMAIWGVEAICVADALCGDLFSFVGMAGMAIASGSVGKICDFFVVWLCAAGRGADLVAGGGWAVGIFGLDRVDEW